jgi:hypothetical protein
MKKKSNKVSYFAISLIMGAIIVSFLFTGFTGFGSNAGEAASVDGTPITTTEYNQALQFNLNRYSQMFGGKSLTNKQIKDFRIRETTLDTLIGQKHILNFADALNFDAGKKSIKSEIMNYEYFQTGGKFDVTKYKSLLQANRLSPTKFEEDVINQVKSNKLQNLISSIQDSSSATKSIMKLRNFKMNTTVLVVDKESLTEFLPVSTKTVTAFVNDKSKDAILKSLYKTYESETNIQNEMATKDKKTKVKKIEAFAKIKSKLAKKHIQKTMREELTAFTEDLKKKLQTAFEKNDTRQIKSLSKRYELNLNAKYDMDLFNLRFENVDFNEDEILAIAKSAETKQVVSLDTPSTIAFLKANSFNKATFVEKAVTVEIKASRNRNAQVIRNAIIDFKSKTTKVTRSPSLFL